jgi:hypothetical protein
MRLTPEQLHSITGLQQPAAQARWFRQRLGAEIPYDERGPIITDKAFEALVAQRCGVATQPGEKARPRVKMKEKV